MCIRDRRQSGLIGILLLVTIILLKEVFRAVAVRIHELNFAIVPVSYTH